jgi:hypothetical protein
VVVFGAPLFISLKKFDMIKGKDLTLVEESYNEGYEAGIMDFIARLKTVFPIDDEHFIAIARDLIDTE